MKKYYADVTYTMYDVEFEVPDDFPEGMLPDMAEEAARDKMVASGPDDTEIEIEDREE